MGAREREREYTSTCEVQPGIPRHIRCQGIRTKRLATPRPLPQAAPPRPTVDSPELGPCQLPRSPILASSSFRKQKCCSQTPAPTAVATAACRSSPGAASCPGARMRRCLWCLGWGGLPLLQARERSEFSRALHWCELGPQRHTLSPPGVPALPRRCSPAGGKADGGGYGTGGQKVRASIMAVAAYTEGGGQALWRLRQGALDPWLARACSTLRWSVLVVLRVNVAASEECPPGCMLHTGLAAHPMFACDAWRGTYTRWLAGSNSFAPAPACAPRVPPSPRRALALCAEGQEAG